MTKTVAFDEVLAEHLRDPEFAAEWERTALAREVANWLVSYRSQHGLTQTALAQQLGWRQPVVSRLELGEHEPTLATLRDLADRLGAEFRIAIGPRHLEVLAAPAADRPRPAPTRRRGRPRRRALA